MKLSLRKAAALVFSSLAVPVAFAADTATLSVSATVSGVCKFTNAAPSMSFTIDPSTASKVDSSPVTISYKCTRLTPSGTFTVGTVSNGATGYLSGTTQATGALASATSTDLLQYSITWTTPAAVAGAGFAAASAAQDVVITGSIAAAQYANAKADTYTGSVAITISP